MRRYETTYIVDGALEPEKIEEISKRIRDIITGAGGVIIEERQWGKRRLAYEIQKRQYGHYVILNYEAAGSVVEEMERYFRINQFILRYLSIYQSPKDVHNMALAAERKKHDEEKALEQSQAVNKTEE